MNVLLIIKVKILVLLKKWSYRSLPPPLIMLAIGLRMVIVV